MVPWRYLEATILVAVMDQSLGTSTSFCSKITLPWASVIWATRSSHSISSYGETPGLVKSRRNWRPGAFFFVGVTSGAGATDSGLFFLSVTSGISLSLLH